MCIACAANTYKTLFTDYYNRITDRCRRSCKHRHTAHLRFGSSVPYFDSKERQQE